MPEMTNSLHELKTQNKEPILTFCNSKPSTLWIVIIPFIHSFFHVLRNVRIGGVIPKGNKKHEKIYS